MADNLLGAKEVVPGNKHFIAPKSLWLFVCLFVLSFGTEAVFASDTDIDIASLGLANDGFVYSGNPMQLGIQMVGSVATVAFVLICMGIVFKLVYAKDFKKNMTIKFDEHLPKWNYTAVPDNA